YRREDRGDRGDNGLGERCAGAHPVVVDDVRGELVVVDAGGVAGDGDARAAADGGPGNEVGGPFETDGDEPGQRGADRPDPGQGGVVGEGEDNVAPQRAAGRPQVVGEQVTVEDEDTRPGVAEHLDVATGRPRDRGDLRVDLDGHGGSAPLEVERGADVHVVGRVPARPHPGLGGVERVRPAREVVEDRATVG